MKIDINGVDLEIHSITTNTVRIILPGTNQTVVYNKNLKSLIVEDEKSRQPLYRSESPKEGDADLHRS